MTDLDEKALAPCPFCGSSDMFTERADFTSCYVVCNDCGSRGPQALQEDDDEEKPGEANAIIEWNKRAYLTARASADVAGVVKRLRGSVTASGGIDMSDPYLLLTAADLLTALSAERDALKKEVERLQGDVLHWSNTAAAYLANEIDAEKRAESAERERDALKAEGMVLVPREPTEAMIRAARERGASFGIGAIYKAMVHAADPSPGAPAMDLVPWIAQLIRDEYDKAPDHYAAGDNWDDGAEGIAKKIAERVRSADDVKKLVLDGLWRSGLIVVPRYPTKEMIDAGAERLVRVEGNARWPDDFSDSDVLAALTEAERVYLSMIHYATAPKGPPPGPQEPPRPPKHRMVA